MIILASEIVKRIGAQRLIELTNESGTSTTIDTDVLYAACQDSIGEFQRITGLAADTSNYSHLAVLTMGVVFFLEDYKSRDGSILSGRAKRFFAACQSLRAAVYVSPTTSSNLKVSTESNTSPDMDRNNNAFTLAGYQTNIPKEYSE